MADRKTKRILDNLVSNNSFFKEIFETSRGFSVKGNKLTFYGRFAYTPALIKNKIDNIRHIECDMHKIVLILN